jgi:hypothetical protein
MRIIPSSRKNRYIVVIIFLAAIALQVMELRTPTECY